MSYFLFSTHSNPDLGDEIIQKSSKLIRGKCHISHYQDGEILVHIDEKVKNKKVYVLGSTFPPAENVLELIILINTLKENGAKSITAIIPYFGYGKQDRIKYSGDAMSAKLMAKIIEDAGADKIIALDLHSQRVEHYFKRVKHLTAIKLLANYFSRVMMLDRPMAKVKPGFGYPKPGLTFKFRSAEFTVISPDQGGVARAKQFAKYAKIKNIAYIEKFRPQIEQIQITKLMGEVKNNNCIIVDDLSQTGGTLIESAKFLKQQGAADIYAALTHLVATGPVVKNLSREKNIKKIIAANSVKLPKSLYQNKKFAIVSSATVFINQLD